MIKVMFNTHARVDDMNIFYSLLSVTLGDLIGGVTFECKANTKLLEQTSHAARTGVPDSS
jgi:hypothetical protein